MSESWVLKGVDAQTREQAVEEAARRGVSLADYLTEVVLHTALTEQVATIQGQIEEIPMAEAASPEAFALRHRLKALERRLGTAVGSLDGSIQALDSTIFDVTARVGEVEALAGDTAHAFRQAQQEANAHFAGVRLHISDVEENSLARDEAAAAAHQELTNLCSGLNQRIDDVEAVATHARAATGALTDAYENLKYAVADDFSAFARESAARLSTGLEQVHAAADSAADQADAAFAEMVADLRAAREALDQRLTESTAETRNKMQSAFADAAERLAALAERVVDNERFTTRATDQLRVQITDVEDGLQTAIEDTAETLRQAQASLAHEVTRAQIDTIAVVEGVRTDLSNEIADLREDQHTASTRLKLLDVAIGTTTGELTNIRDTFSRQIAQIAIDGSSHREALERQIAQSGIDVAAARQTLDRRLEQAAADARADIDQTQSVWEDRFNALSVRFANAERENTETRAALRAEDERVEACTFAALQKLARDMSAADAGLDGKIAQVHQTANAAIADIRTTLEEQYAAATARTQRTEGNLADLETKIAPVGDRLSKLEGVAHALDTEFAARISRLERAAEAPANSQHVAELKQQLETLVAEARTSRPSTDALALIEDLRARIGATEVQSGEIADRLHGVARMLNRVSAQQTEAATQTEERLHKIEMAVADVRLTQIAPPAPDHSDAIESIIARMEAMERRQAEALSDLQADIVRFVTDNDQRLALMEQNGGATVSGEPTDLEIQFADLRRRIEERILGVEQRGVRTLEHVADTIALLEKRFLDQDEERQTA